MLLKRFNVRVYGLLINERGQVLVADEVFKNGGRATKFPGGGVELGEGLRDAVKREFMEEAGVDAEAGEHFYTTDFFVPSAFDNESQVIAVYYLMRCENWAQIKTTNVKFNFSVPPGQEAESFRWVQVDALMSESELTLPTDRVAAQMLCDRFS